MEESNQSQMKYILVGSLFLMLAIAAHGLALATIQGPILSQLNGLEWFSTVTILSSIAICVMTPIGGSLCGILGPGKLTLYSGAASIIFGLIMAFTNNIWIFIVCRVIVAITQGAYASVPFVIVNTELPRDKSPKWVGYLSMTGAIGGLVGSFIAGFFADRGMLGLAMSFPLIFLAIAMFLICPHSKNATHAHLSLDWPGIILLTITLSGILMGLNNGPVDGWFSKGVMISFFVGFAALIAYIWWEGKAKAPLMPLRIFRTKEFTLVLLIGFLFSFYTNAVNVYVPQAAQDVMQVSSAASGSIQMPKTIIMLFLPAIAGAWIVKNPHNIWKSLALSGLFCAVAFALMIFVGPKMPLWFLMFCVALTAITETLRSVGLLPAVQWVLPKEDIAIGTSMIGFIMTLSGSVASAFFGLAYNYLTAQTPGIRGMTDGIDTINLMVCFLSIIGVLLVFLFFRPLLDKRINQRQAAEAQLKK